MRILRRYSLLGVIVVLLSPVIVRADVADSAANEFTVKIAITIQAHPQDVYRRLVHYVGDWWNSMHTFSGDARNLSIDDKPWDAFASNFRTAVASGIWKWCTPIPARPWS
jgi:hypothetical protein